MTSLGSPHQKGMRSRILSMVWTASVLGLLLMGLGYWSISQLSTLREQESKLLKGQLFLAKFIHESKLLDIVASKSLIAPDRTRAASDIGTENLKEYQDFERFYVDHKQTLLELGSDLGKLDEAKQFNGTMDGMLLSLRNALESMRDKNAIDPALFNLGPQWERSNQFTGQILRGLAAHTAQESEATTELLSRKSVALTFINLAAAIIFLVAFSVLGITVASSIHRESILSSDKVTQNFGSMSHTLLDLSRAGHALASATSLHQGKITETLEALKDTPTFLGQMRSDSHALEQCSLETCLRLDEGVDALGCATKAVQAARDTSPVLNQLLGVLAALQKKMTDLQHIASKTQMLSYNASIEAARAGEHGRGFAVLALELSRVADLGTKATDDMSVALETSTNATVQSTQTFSLAMDDLEAANTLAAEQIGKMIPMARAVHLKIGDVKEQIVKHTKTINGCLTGITAVQATARSKEDVLRGLAGLSDILNHQSGELTATFDQMRVLLHGSQFVKGLAVESSKGIMPKSDAAKVAPPPSMEAGKAPSEIFGDQPSGEPDASGLTMAVTPKEGQNPEAIEKDPLTADGDQTMRKSA